jgi:hypothetical protein
MSHPILQQNDKEVPSETFELLDPDTGDPIDLTGILANTIFIYIRLKGAVANKWTDAGDIQATSVVVPETLGKITYDFPGALEEGKWEAEIEIPVGGSQTRFSERIDIEVIPGLKP